MNDAKVADAEVARLAEDDLRVAVGAALEVTRRPFAVLQREVEGQKSVESKELCFFNHRQTKRL